MTTLEHPIADTPTEPTVPMHCMEIWGGMESANEYVTVPGIDAWVYAEPHDGSHAGGDIHYMSLCGGGNISRFMVADIAGHGQSVAEVAGQFRKLMRKHINTPNQARFAQSLNESFGGDMSDGRFATALIATYFAPNDHLILVNAGHPRPLWYSAQKQQWILLDDASACCVHKVSAGMRDLPLGVIGETDYTQFAVPLGKGDLVVIYTDSLIEASDASGRQLGQAGLLELARQHCIGEPHTLGRRLLDAVGEYRGGAPSDDDVTLFVLHHNAADPPSLSVGDWMRVMARMSGLVKV